MKAPLIPLAALPALAATSARFITGILFTPFRISGHLYEIQPMYSDKYHACVTVP